MDSRQFVQLSQVEFTFVRQHRTSWPDARGAARADKSTAASAEELRAYLQATILPADDNTQDPTAASSSEPQRLQAPWVNPTRQEWELVVEPTNDHRYNADQWSDTSAIASAVAWPSDWQETNWTEAASTVASADPEQTWTEERVPESTVAPTSIPTECLDSTSVSARLKLGQALVVQLSLLNRHLTQNMPEVASAKPPPEQGASAWLQLDGVRSKEPPLEPPTQANERRARRHGSGYMLVGRRAMRYARRS